MGSRSQAAAASSAAAVAADHQAVVGRGRRCLLTESAPVGAGSGIDRG